MKHNLLLLGTLLVLAAVILKVDSRQQVAHSQSTSGATAPLYRLHDFNTDQYVVTTSSIERDNFITQGWTYEKIIGNIYTSSSAASGLISLYRLKTNNHYTLTTIGDTIPIHSTINFLGYVFPSSKGSGQPVWQANNQAENAVLWTGNITEYNDLSSGWQQNGILCYLPSSTTVGNPGWPKQFGTVGDETSARTVLDHSGSVYILGGGDGNLFGANLGSDDCFVAKYDTNGNFLWGKQFGTSTNDIAISACVDSNNNLYVAGVTDGALFGSNSGDTDSFIFKLSPSGSTLWSKQFGTTGSDFADDVTIDAQNHIYMVGQTEGSLFGQPSGVATRLSPVTDTYIVEYDTNGGQLWSKQFGNGNSSSASRIRIDTAGNIYLAGDGIPALGLTVTGYDAYVAKYSSNMTLLWDRQFGSPNRGDLTSVNGLCIDVSGNVYAVGDTNVHDDIDGNPDTGDGYITKFDTNGNSLWTQRWATAFDDGVSDLGLDSQGYIYAVGSTAGSLFAPFTGGKTNSVLAKYDANGNLISSVQYGSDSLLTSIVVDTQNRLYLVGGASTSLVGPCAGGDDIFIQRLNSNGQMAKALGIGFPKVRHTVDALGVRSIPNKLPTKNILQFASAGKVTPLNYPPVLVGNQPYMYIGYAGIGAKDSRVIQSKGSHKQVIVASRERQVVVNYGSSNFSLNGQASKMPGKPLAIGKDCYVPLEVIQAAVPVHVNYDAKAKRIVFDPPQLAMRKFAMSKV